MVSGGQLILHDPAQELAWIAPSAEPFTRADIQLKYDFLLPKKKTRSGKAPNGKSRFPWFWPGGATREEVKVRVWSEAGTRPFLADQPSVEEAWKDFGIEIVPGNDVLPALVLHGTGTKIPLSLRLAGSIPSGLALSWFAR